MRLPCLSLSSVVNDMLKSLLKRLFCDWQSELMMRWSTASLQLCLLDVSH